MQETMQDTIAELNELELSQCETGDMYLIRTENSRYTLTVMDVDPEEGATVRLQGGTELFANGEEVMRIGSLRPGSPDPEFDEVVRRGHKLVAEVIGENETYVTSVIQQITPDVSE